MTTILITHDLNLAKSMKGAVLFAEEGSAHYFQDSRAFFTEKNLKKHYGIAFNSRALGLNYG